MNKMEKMKITDKELHESNNKYAMLTQDERIELLEKQIEGIIETLRILTKT